MTDACIIEGRTEDLNEHEIGRDEAKNEEIKEYEIKFLDENDLNQVLKLQGIVTKNLTDPTSYYVEPEEFFRKQLTVDSSVIGLFHKQHLVGFNVTTFPGLEEENMGADVHLDTIELLQVAQIGPAAVHPDYRNKKIFSKLAKEHIKEIGRQGYRHIFLTVAPTNYPTVKIFINNKFVIRQLKTKYNNVLRYILHLDLQDRFKQPKYSARISNMDIESQKFIMGLGFYGYDVIKKENSFDVIFGHDEIEASL